MQVLRVEMGRRVSKRRRSVVRMLTIFGVVARRSVGTPSVGLAAMLVLGVLLTAGLACDSLTTSSNGSKLGPIPTAAIEYDLPRMTIADWTARSDLIVAGTVLKVDEPRWNSPDGKRWSQHSGDSDSEPLVYQTFYVQPQEILKGTPEWGAPIAFRAWWNTSTGAGPVAAGDPVVAFGELDPGRYGPKGVYQPAEAYWLTSDNNSLWLKDGRSYVNQGHLKDEAAERSLTLDELEARIQEAATTATTLFVRESAEAGWGEMATFDGLLQITATAPQPDPSGRLVPAGGSDAVILYSTITLKNIGTHPRSYDPQWFVLLAGDEGWGGGSDGVQTSIKPPLAAGTLQPGETVTGSVPFQFTSWAASHIRNLVFDTSPSYESEQPALHVEWR